MLPVRLDDQGVKASDKTRARRSWIGIGLRMVRDAAVAVAFMTLVPIAVVGFKGENAWGYGNFGNDARAKLALSEAYRPLALPKDPSITPMQAGLAFNALQQKRESAVFPIVELASRPEHSWERVPMTDDMFVDAKMTFGFNGPASAVILERVSKGFTPKESAYLHVLATAPVWREFDLVARAPGVDIIGGSFKLPFPDNADLNRMPVSYKATRELAYASVARAAYHLSVGQRDSAETALRSVISFGYAMVDNGHTVMDELVGNVIAAIGRDALVRFYVITKDPRATLPALARPGKIAGGRGSRLPLDEMRRFLIAETANTNEHLGMRFEALRLLSAASCTNVKELMFGNNSDVTSAIEGASTNLARYPSERALVERLAELQQPNIDEIQYSPIRLLAVSSATVAGTVLRNPRLAACTRIVTSYYGGPW